MTKNVYFHDNVMFILKTSPGSTVLFPCDLSCWRTASAVSQRLWLELAQRSLREYA